jgi:hypothetical protein
MATAVSNHFMFHLISGDVDINTDSLKICLMADGFVFDIDAHEEWADVSANELAGGSGYTQDTATLSATPTVTENDTDNRIEVTWDNEAWTASGGSIGPTPGAIIKDDTETDEVIVFYIDFGEDKTQADGGVFTITNIELRVRQPRTIA